MAQPTAYDRQASFSNIQAQAPSDPLPGQTVDAEFNSVKETLDEILTNLALIQRDDGALANASVGLDQLSEEIEVGWEAPVVWVTGTAYSGNKTVFNGSGFYRLLTAHTAGTFATDLAAGKWELIVDLSALTIVDATQIANTPAGSIAATTVQAAIDELASEKAAASHTHPSSAITDGTAAGRALLTATDVTAQRTALELGDLALLDTIPVTDIDAEIAFSGIIEPAALGSSVNDWAPTGIGTCSTIRASASTSGVIITGMLAPAADGDIKIIENVGATYSLTVAKENTSSAAANRFLIPGPIDIPPNSAKAFKYDLDGTTPRWRLLDTAHNFPRGHLVGLTLSNNTSDATNDIDIAAGEARGTLGILNMTLTSAMTKRLDANWSAGTGNGMRYSGGAIANSTYHIFLIGKLDGTVDIFTNTGVDPSSILPADYVDYRRIGSILRETGVIVPFKQTGDHFLRKSIALITATNPGTSAVLQTVATPLGIVTEADLSFGITANADIAVCYGLITQIDATDEAPSVGRSHVQATDNAVGGTAVSAVSRRVFTNVASEIRWRISTSDANTIARIDLSGWWDRRGKDTY